MEFHGIQIFFHQRRPSQQLRKNSWKLSHKLIQTEILSKFIVNMKKTWTLKNIYKHDILMPMKTLVASKWQINNNLLATLFTPPCTLENLMWIHIALHICWCLISPFGGICFVATIKGHWVAKVDASWCNIIQHGWIKQVALVWPHCCTNYVAWWDRKSVV